MNVERVDFLLALKRRGGVVGVRNLPPQVTQAENSARQWCKRNGYAKFEGSEWRLTEKGLLLIEDQP